MRKKYNYSSPDVLGIISFHKSTDNNSSIQVRLNKGLKKYFTTGYVCFNPVKMTIREGTIIDRKTQKLTNITNAGFSFSFTTFNRDEWIGDYELEESLEEKQLYLLYKIGENG